MPQHFNIRIFGRVQDIGFRYSCKQQADSLRLGGFVKNHPDGSVYVEVEGENPALAEFLAWCQKGPRFAKVTRCETSEGAVKNFQNFGIV